MQIGTGVELAISLGTRMLLQVGAEKDKLSSELVGMHAYDFLLIRMPMIPGARNKLGVGQELVVRYMNEGIIYGFTARVIGQQMKPIPLLFIEYPSRIEQVPLRKQPRIQCMLPCEVHGEHGEYKGFITDLSIGGCRIILEVPDTDPLHALKAEEALVVQANLFSGEGNTTLSCLCRNVESSKTALQLGVAFFELPEHVGTQLKEYIGAISSFT